MEKIEHEILTFIWARKLFKKTNSHEGNKCMFSVNFYMDLTKKLNLQECAAKMISFYAKNIFL